jgi:hypothetical protein
MPATTSKPKLNAAQARAIANAEIAAAQAKAHLELAEKTRNELRAKYLSRIPVATDVDDAAKDVREAEAGGWIIRVSGEIQTESFSLKRYTDLGHRITAAMRAAIKPGDPYRRWTVKRVEGPFKPGSVEPA